MFENRCLSSMLKWLHVEKKAAQPVIAGYLWP
jgi:hypothetical protein